MFEQLTEKIGNIFKKLGGKGKLSEKEIDEALREIRLALLDADVNLKVVKEFTTKIRERALTATVLESLTPAQQIIKIVHEELINILGGKPGTLVAAPHPPSVIMLVGLQGSGKTTTAAKLALHLRRNGQRPLLVAADTRRPAAIEQLVTLGKQLDIPVYTEEATVPPPTIGAHALERAREIAATWVIVDTQGRLHIDEAMMKEVVEVKNKLSPSEVLLVVDAMTGQEAVRIAEQFHSNLALSGLILTKMDGDARGGAALSIKMVSGVPIKFLGVGEKADALELFYPDRLASRILGMGDMLTLIEKAETAFDQQRLKEMEKKIRSATFDLEDFLWQLRQIKKMGSLSQILEMIPGLSTLASRAPSEIEEKRVKRIEAIICSMTPEERRNPALLNGSRRQRIARGSGTTIQELNQLLNQFRQMQKMMKQLDPKKMRRFLSTLR